MDNKQLYNILKAKFLVDDDALKNWLFIIYLIFLAMIMISNNHWYDQKAFKINKLEREVKDLKSRYVETKSNLMQLKMESNVAKVMEPKGILPASVPPVKITVEETKEDNFWNRLWQ